MEGVGANSQGQRSKHYMEVVNEEACQKYSDHFFISSRYFVQVFLAGPFVILLEWNVKLFLKVWR